VEHALLVSAYLVIPSCCFDQYLQLVRFIST
jgi:hypothetical protein